MRIQCFCVFKVLLAAKEQLAKSSSKKTDKKHKHADKPSKVEVSDDDGDDDSVGVVPGSDDDGSVSE